MTDGTPTHTPKMTCVFDCDVRSLAINPHKAETPFGQPTIVSVGDLAAENYRLREALQEISAIDDFGRPPRQAMAIMRGIARTALGDSHG